MDTNNGNVTDRRKRAEELFEAQGVLQKMLPLAAIADGLAESTSQTPQETEYAMLTKRITDDVQRAQKLAIEMRFDCDRDSSSEECTTADSPQSKAAVPTVNASSYQTWLDSVVNKIGGIVQSAMAEAANSHCILAEGGKAEIDYPRVLEEFEDLIADHRRGEVGKRTELLDEVRTSLQNVVQETEEAYKQAELGELEGDDYETLAHAYLTLRQWADDWLLRAK
jgi:hypothetical protein